MIGLLFSIVFFLTPLNLAAQPCAEKNDTKNSAQLMAEEILKVFKVDHWSASSEDIQNSPCKGIVPTLDSMRAVNDKLLGGATVNQKTIVGAKFENESEQMLRMFDLLVQKREFSGEGYVLPNQKDYSHLTSGNCKKVRCALNQLFGEEYSENAMYLLSNYELNISPVGLRGDKTKKFPPEELRSIHQSVADLPKDLFPIKIAKSLRRSSLDAGSTLGNATIIFFEGFKKYNHHEKAGVCTHEFAHNFSNLGNLDESPEWLNISGWIDRGGVWGRDSSTDNLFVSNYATRNPAEDFAESVVAYRYNPEGLRAASVEKYNFIKELVFKGREYTAAGDNSCQGKTNFEKEVEKTFSNVSGDGEIADEELLFDKTIEVCNEELLNRFMGSTEEGFELCLEKIVKKKLINKNWSKVKEEFLYPEKAKELLDKNFYNLDLKNTDKNLKRYVENIDKKLQSIEQESMKKIVESMNLSREYTNAKTIDEFCRDDISRYGYQNYYGLNVGVGTLFLYRNKEKLNTKVMKVCKSAFKKMSDLRREVRLSDVL